MLKEAGRRKVSRFCQENIIDVIDMFPGKRPKSEQIMEFAISIVRWNARLTGVESCSLGCRE